MSKKRNIPIMLFMTNIQIIIGDGCDIVTLNTILPSPVPKIYGRDTNIPPLSLNFNAEQGTGEAYCQEHFPGVPIEVIDTRKGR